MVYRSSGYEADLTATSLLMMLDKGNIPKWPSFVKNWTIWVWLKTMINQINQILKYPAWEPAG
jgi:hypothetical protein